MMSFFRELFDTTGFPARWNCGHWSDAHGWVHILSDIAIFGAYAAIPLALAYFILRRKDVPFVPIFWLFATFIVSCGFTHLIEATIFWHPWYRFSGLVKVVTAVVSWMTVIALIKIIPSALSLPGLAKINRQLSEEIAERKRAEETLRLNESLVSMLIEQAPLGVYVVNAQFRLQQVNSLALPIFGTVSPLIGRDFTEVMEILWGQKVGGEIARIFKHTLETGERYISKDFVSRRADLGVEQAFDWEAQRMSLPDGRHGVVCYFSEVTQRRRAEAALMEAKEAAETANQSKDRFLAVLSHELRTPLNPVLMTVAALEQDAGLRPEMREDLAMIRRNVELEARLIDDLLDLSRITSGKVALKREAVDLNEIVRHVSGICTAQMVEKKIHFETTLGDEVGFLFADPTRLQQILWNVLKVSGKRSTSVRRARESVRMGE